MKSFFFLAIIFVTLVQSTYAADSLPSEFDEFLRSRTVLASVSFAPGETTLSPSAKQEIDRIVPKLRGLDPLRSLIRIEGFATPDGSEEINVLLSMLRAKAVIDYLSVRHRFAADLFLTGHGSGGRSAVHSDGGRTADIALYDNLWDIGDTAVVNVILR